MMTDTEPDPERGVADAAQEVRRMPGAVQGRETDTKTALSTGGTAGT